MKPERTVLVLGGGTGGIVAATRLRKLLPPAQRIVLVDRQRNHLFQPSLLWLLVGKRAPERIQRPLNRLRSKGIEVLTGVITEIDPEKKSVRVDGTEISADAMVISLGADLTPQNVPGLSTAGHNLYTLAGAVAARDALQAFRSGRVVVLTAAPAYKCPAAPYEAAMLVNDFLGRNGATVEVFAAEPGPMGTAGPEISAAVRSMVEAQGIAYHPNHQIDHVDGRHLRFADGTAAPFDVLLYVPPHQAPAVVREARLTGPSGWISVDREKLTTGIPGLHAIGDVTAIPLSSGKMLPKAGVFAHAQAEVVAANIAAEWGYDATPRPFDGKGGCFLETGAGRAGFGNGDFYAEPAPQMRLRKPSRLWHLGKVLFEKRWLHTWF